MLTSMTPEHAVVAAILICLGGAVLTLLVSRWRTLAGWMALAATAAAAGFIFWAVTHVLTHGPGHPATFWAMPKFGFALHIYVDGLTAVFLTLAAVIALPACLYSIRYMRHYKEYSVARYYPHFMLFLAAMFGLVSTTDMMWFFFIFWQLMTLPGYALIRFENKNRANIRAANKYLVMMEIACVATMIGAELIALNSGLVGGENLKYDFDTVSLNLPLLLQTKPGMTALAFALFLVGFGIKMGMWPFGQIWLPDAHPAAPSPVSAMLSGVMIKTGVYGLIRYFLWLVPREGWANYPLAEWGMVVAVLGTVTLFTGTMQALRQDQTKRLLAFSSIGQVGYMLLGVGACMALAPLADERWQALAAVAFLGALFHVLNHGVFKSLLFLNAGSLLNATGTQDLNKMGGLMRFMPWSALTALVASLAISGVPLTSGFASKWNIFVAVIQGTGGAGYLAVCGLIAILTSALTLALFVKFFGASFLSRTSALVAEQAARRSRLEADGLMLFPKLVLAAGCVAMGLFPAVVFRFLQIALEASQQGFGTVLAKAQPVNAGVETGLAAVSGTAVYLPLVLLAVMGLIFLGVRFLSKLGGGQRRAAVPWLCGYVREADCHRYVARNFYGEIKRHFRWLDGASRPETGKSNDVKEH